MMKHVPAAVLLALTIELVGGNALACGGCFQPQSADSIVTGHRMAFALSPDRTVLWDQITYSGNPAEFGWVLPVSPGAFIEESSDAWFESLDAVTKVTVTAPPLKCATSSNGGCGFGSADSAALGSASVLGNGVEVLHQGTVGPYETVTLASTDGSKLRDWLAGHGYGVPPEIEPVIDTYVAEGANFIALRLTPGKSVSSMTPVRVVTPHGPAMLPLRMVAAGTGAYVDVILYLIGEGRYQLDDFTETHVELGNLAFDFTKNSSNYLTLREDALRQNDGYSFLTAFATGDPFGPTSTFNTVSSGGIYRALPDLYFAQAESNAGVAAYPPPCNERYGDYSSGQLVGDGTGSTISADTFTCNSHSDISTALIGMHPNRVWLTRLELNLPHEALSADCKVSLSEAQKEVSKNLTAVKAVNRPAFCAEPVFESGFAPAAGAGTQPFAWAVASFGALYLLRRRRDHRE